MISIINTILIIVMSFNVRYNNPSDGINSWDNRKEMVVDLIQKNSPDFLGMQEVKKSQMNYLINQLINYGYFSQSRTEDPEDESCPIFYDKNKFILKESNTFWLSETPENPSRGWDASFNRIVTWGKFQHKETGKIFYYFNTHFDHAGVKARLESAKLLRKKIEEITVNDDYFVTGDFNFDPSTDYYKVLTSDSLSGAQLINVSQSFEETERNKGTFTGFDLSKPPSGPIDYIFTKPTISVKSYQVIDTKYEGRLPSDHYPIKAVLGLKVD